MSPITREDFWRAFEKGQPLVRDKVLQQFAERLSAKASFTIHQRLDPNGNTNLNLNDSPEFVAWRDGLIDSFIALTAAYLIESVTAGADQVDTTAEIANLKTRLARLELEIIRMLPPDFQRPSSDDPRSN